MTPTPEQVAQWAREAGEYADAQYQMSWDAGKSETWEVVRNGYLVTRAMAEQAEADAKLAEEEDVASSDDPFGVQDCIVNRIRANAPKVTT